MLVVISGGSQGLGKFIAAEYMGLGHQVYIVARTTRKLNETVKELQASHPRGSIKSITGDVSNPAYCDKVFRLTGVPDLVICCAGAAHTGFFVEHSVDTLSKNLKTVYDTALYFSHSAMKSMANAPDKLQVSRKIVFVSSVVAVFPLIGYSAYAPAKAAIRALSDIVAQEGIEHNIKVSHVMPGSMDTPGFDQENLTKPQITKDIEGASAAISPESVARQVVNDIEKGERTIFTDTIGWVLGSMQMGLSPRVGWGILETLVALVLALVGRIISWSINNDIRKNAVKRRP